VAENPGEVADQQDRLVELPFPGPGYVEGNGNHQVNARVYKVPLKTVKKMRPQGPGQTDPPLVLQQPDCGTDNALVGKGGPDPGDLGPGLKAGFAEMIFP